MLYCGNGGKLLCYPLDMFDSSALAAPVIPSPESVTELLVRHGYRSTAPRRAVVADVLARSRPFTAEEVVVSLRTRAPEIGRATVYRTLELLASVDVLSRVLRSDGHPAYIAGTPGHRHHLVCSDCGEAVTFSACPVDELIRDLSRDTQFRIQGHMLEVFGLCPACQPAVQGGG